MVFAAIVTGLVVIIASLAYLVEVKDDEIKRKTRRKK